MPVVSGAVLILWFSLALTLGFLGMWALSLRPQRPGIVQPSVPEAVDPDTFRLPMLRAAGLQALCFAGPCSDLPE